MSTLSDRDPEVFDAIAAEEHRQRDELELIASENYTSRAVMEAVGSVLTNKYAEGLPGRGTTAAASTSTRPNGWRSTGPSELFGADHANVQPHSGASANLAVYYAALEIGDTVLAMDLAHGGHLTHGMKLNYSGRWYKTIGYGLDRETERIDYDAHRPAGPRAQAEADPRRRQRLLADHRVRPDRRDRPRGRRRLLRRHGPHRRPGRRRAAPEPGPGGRLRHDDHAQDPPRPRGAASSSARPTGPRSSTRPSSPASRAGPLEHVIAGKAVCFGEALGRRLQGLLPPRSSPTPRPSAEELTARRLPAHLRAGPTTT